MDSRGLTKVMLDFLEKNDVGDTPLHLESKKGMVEMSLTTMKQIVNPLRFIEEVAVTFTNPE